MSDDKGKALRDHPRWRWMEGMWTRNGLVVVESGRSINRDHFIGFDTDAYEDARVDLDDGRDGREYPDMHHPATVGCLREMLWGECDTLEIAGDKIDGVFVEARLPSGRCISAQSESLAEALADVILGVWRRCTS